MPKLFIAVPVFDSPKLNFVQNLLVTLQVLRDKNIPHEVRFHSEALICKARNMLTGLFLASDATHMLFWDADVVANPEGPIMLLESGLPLIGVPYSIKRHNYRFAAAQIFPDTVVTDQPFEVRRLGLGYTLIEKAVFEAIAAAHPELTYQPDVMERKTIAGNLHHFFGVSIVENALVPEDFSFCDLYRGVGGKIFCHPGIYTEHLGNCAFTFAPPDCNSPAPEELSGTSTDEVRP